MHPFIDKPMVEVARMLKRFENVITYLGLHKRRRVCYSGPGI